MLAIYKRELRSFFHGMMGYLLTAFLLAASGIYFLALNLGYGLTDFWLLYALPHDLHAAALFPGAGHALAGRRAPRPHRPAPSHQRCPCGASWWQVS